MKVVNGWLALQSSLQLLLLDIVILKNTTNNHTKSPTFFITQHKRQHSNLNNIVYI